jgi:hypothetical protein
VENADPVAVLECSGCGWWCFFWEDRPTIPLVCDYCKMGLPPWEIRKETPSYGTPRARQQTIPFGIEEETTGGTRLVIVEETIPPPAPKKKRKR